ncbi:hypothetical protein K458DRAFT_465673, partial [Lentithecium fluviatile CBS 122367]
YFVHQSAKDFLFAKALNEIFPSGIEEGHYEIFSKSLEAMSRTLMAGHLRLVCVRASCRAIETARSRSISFVTLFVYLLDRSPL